MRDLLTGIAIIVILVLAAALVAPYAVDWQERRGDVEAALSQALGAEVKTSGDIQVRLLPSPVLSLANVTVRDAGKAQLSARRIAAELAVAPLLRGEFRFTDATLERPVVRVAAMPNGSFVLPRLRLTKSDAGSTAISIERLSIADGTLIVSDGDIVHDITGIWGTVKAQSLRGPWSVDSVVGGQPLRISTGEMSDEGLRIKASFGDETKGKLEADGLLALTSDRGALVPTYSGKASFARRVSGTNGEPAMLAVAGNVTSRERSLTADGLTLEVTSPRYELKLAGSGRLELGARPELALTLQGRRIDASELWTALLAADAGGIDTFLRLPPMPVTLNVSVGSLLANDEEVTNVETAFRWSSGRVEIERFAATLPGETTLSLVGGRIRSRAAFDFRGHIALASKAPSRLALALARFNLPQSRAETLARLPDIAVESDIVLSPDVLALRGFQLKTGGAAMTGLMRYSPGEGVRGRFDAQIAAEGVDIATLPEGDIFGPILRGVDIGLAIDGQRISFGPGTDAGRVRAKINTHADAVEFESLDVIDLAGVNLKIGGRLGSDGAGSIDGTLEAERAEPVVALATKLGADMALARLLPRGFMDGRLKFSIAAQAAGGTSRSFSVALDGTAAEISVKARLKLKGDLTPPLSDADVLLTAPDVKPVLARLGLSAEASGPLDLSLIFARDNKGERSMALNGTIGGVALKTETALAVDRPERPSRFRLSTPDAAPLGRALGLALEAGRPVPLNVALGIDKPGGNWRLKLDGAAGDTPVVGDAEIGSDGRLMRGGIALDRLALPTLLSLVALGPLPVERPGSFWPSSRFAAAPELPLAGELVVTSQNLDLGAGFLAQAVRLRLAPGNDGVTITVEQGQIAGGTVLGTLTLRRLGGSAALNANLTFENVRIERLAGTDVMAGSSSGALRFGGTGESVAAIVANLSGAGSLRLANFKLERLNAEAVQRVITSTRGDANALDAKRLQGLIGEQFGRSAFTASTVEMPVTIVGGVVRASPVVADGGPSAWQGAVSVDLKSLNIDANGLLVSRSRPEGWTGLPPQVSLAWRGPLAAPRRDTDASALAASLAAIHLTKELERVEAMEAEMRRIRAEREKREADRAEEERRQREAALKAEEERRRQREAALKAEEERRQRELAKVEEERRQREATLKAEEERRQRESAKAEEERRREAESRAERDALKALIEGTAPTGSQPIQKLPENSAPQR